MFIGKSWTNTLDGELDACYTGCTETSLHTRLQMMVCVGIQDIISPLYLSGTSEKVFAANWLEF